MITTETALKALEVFNNNSESGACLVRADSTYNGYALTIANKLTGSESFMALCAAPNDKDLSAMGKFIHNAIKTLYANFDENKVTALASEINNWCNKVVGTYVLDLLTNNTIKAEHCYIKCALVGRQRSDSQFHGRIKMVMCRNQAELYQINSRQLARWLTENPETPIYQTLTAQEVERDLIADAATTDEQIEIDEITALMTTAQRFKTKIELYSDKKMLFNKTGIKYPSNAALARIKNY